MPLWKKLQKNSKKEDEHQLQKGKLEKKPHGFGFAKERFFVLTRKRMFYAKTEQSDTELGTFEVSDIIKVREKDNNSRGFEIETANRVWKLSAKTHEEAREWISAIKLAMSQNESRFCFKEKLDELENITDKVPEQFRGLSVWLELPTAQSLIDEIAEATGTKNSYVPHITLLYGIKEKESSVEDAAKRLAERLTLCYRDWDSLRIKPTKMSIKKCEEMQLSFLDLSFQLSRELNEIFRMTVDCFKLRQKFQTVTRPRACFCYNEDYQALGKGLEILKKRKSAGELPEFTFGKVSIQRAGEAGEWQRLQEYEIQRHSVRL